MDYAILAGFDESTCREIEQLRTQFPQYEPLIEPHVTLLEFNTCHLDSIKYRLQHLPHGIQIPTLDFETAGFFLKQKKVCVALPVMTRALLDFQTEIYELMSVFFDAQSDYHLPDQWIPHLTLSLDLPDEAAILDCARILNRSFKTLSIHPDHLILYGCCPYRKMGEFSLLK